MKAIINMGIIPFVKDDDSSDELIEVYRAECNLNNYRLKIDKTTYAPYYELYLDWVENKRPLTHRLFASGSLDKVENWVIQNI